MATPRVGINFNRFKISKSEMLVTALVTFFSIFLAKLCDKYFGIDDYSLIFITAVVYLASRFSMVVVVLAATIFFIAYDFFFLYPLNSLDIFAKQGIITLLAFSISALIAGRLATRLRNKILELEKHNRRSYLMEQLARQLSITLNTKEAIESITVFFKKQLGVNAQIELINANSSLKNFQNNRSMTELDVLYHSEKDSFVEHAKAIKLPLYNQDQPFGFISLESAEDNKKNIVDEKFLELVIDYITQVLHRMLMAEQLEQTELLAQIEHLRSSILSSISHDLRTPLASIKGVTETLTSYEAQISNSDKLTLMETLHDEAERLDQYIESLINMTKVAGDLTLSQEWVSVDEVIGAAVQRLKRYRPTQLISSQLPTDDFALHIDYPLIEQAIFNVLDNASKYSNQKPITIIVHAVNQLVIEIHDEGSGFLEDEIAFVFQKFFRGKQYKNVTQGTGLGLSIVEAIMKAHGAIIQISKSTITQGACLTFSFPEYEINASGDMDDE